MSLQPPSEFPNWATDDQVDPVSMQNNVLVPPSIKQQYGFARLDFAPRNWFNYLFRTINDWLKYLAQQAGLTVVANGSGGTPVVNVVTGGMAKISVVSTNSGESANFYEGIVYVPPGYSSGTLNFNTINSATITVSAITAGGTVTASGGSGPYIINVTMSNIP